MKTSIIKPRAHDLDGGNPSRFGRFYAPGEVPAEGEPAPFRKATFCPAHVSKGTQVVSMNPWKTRPFSKKVGDAILGCELERGKSVCARVIPETYVHLLHDLDEQIEKLSADRREIVEEAYRHGRPLRKADLVPAEEAAS